jgi:phosphomannomutase
LSEAPDRLAERAVVQVSRLDGLTTILEEGSWLLLRPSGWEPAVGVYVEASTVQHIEALIAEGKTLLGKNN